MKKSNKIIALIIIAVIAVILLVSYLKNSSGITEEDAKCIAGKSLLFVSKTCSHCAQQKQILGKHIKYFSLVDCLEEPEKCNDIKKVPTWIINEEKYEGVQNLNELKKLAGC